MARLGAAWVLANVAGGLVGFGAGGLALTGLLHPQGSRSGLEVLAVLICSAAWPLIAGGTVALAQWRVLRAWLSGPDRGRWLRRNAVLWLVGTAAAAATVYLGEFTRHPPSDVPISLLLAGLVLGISVGIGQWTMLEHVSPRGWIWLLAVPLGYAAGAFAGTGVAAVTMHGSGPSDWVIVLVLGPALGGAAGGGVSGIITGAALVWLLREAHTSG
jgi:hypothetical protein